MTQIWSFWNICESRMIPNPSTPIGVPSLGLASAVAATVLELASVAWSRARASIPVGTTPNEPELAGILRDEMVQEKAARGLELRIQEEVGTRSRRRRKPDGRIDIMVIYSFNEEEYFAVECKRVCVSKRSLARAYVSQGVARFISGKYASGHDAGAMIGFAMDCDCLGCAYQVADCLRKKVKELAIVREWRDESPRLRLQNVYSTGHDDGQHVKSFELFHLFLSLN